MKASAGQPRQQWPLDTHDSLEGILALLVCSSLATGLLALGCGAFAAFLGHDERDLGAVEVVVVLGGRYGSARAGVNSNRGTRHGPKAAQRECVPLQPRVTQRPKREGKKVGGAGRRPAMAGVRALQTNHVRIAFLSLARAIRALNCDIVTLREPLLPLRIILSTVDRQAEAGLCTQF